MLVSGCASTGSTTEVTGSTERTWTNAEAEARLRSAAADWDGVAHEWGGSSHRGVDCSGLVQSIFEDEFGLSVPRTTQDQATIGRNVSRSRLRPGDLVFFRPEFKKRHVGIYVSDGEFLHASSSDGVTVSKLDGSYWTDSWWQARRLLSSPGDSTHLASDSTTQRPAPNNVGW